MRAAEKPRELGLCLVFTLLASLSKESAFALPLVFFFTDVGRTGRAGAGGFADGLKRALGRLPALGAVAGAVRQARDEGLSVSQVHLRYVNPLPSDLGDVLSRFEKVLVPEMNSGQLAFLLRAEYLRDVISYSKVKGKPFFRTEIYDKIKEILETRSDVG